MLIAVVVIVVGSVCWLERTLGFFPPSNATTPALRQPEDDPEYQPSMVETRAEGLAGVLLTWILPASAVMMLLGNPLWPAAAGLGAGVYLYFPSVLMLRRRHLARSGQGAMDRGSAWAVYGLGIMWMSSGLAMLLLAFDALLS
jgi:hypothetical protein